LLYMAAAMHLNDNIIVFDEIHYIIINNMRHISFICTEFHTIDCPRKKLLTLNDDCIKTV